MEISEGAITGFDITFVKLFTITFGFHHKSEIFGTRTAFSSSLSFLADFFGFPLIILNFWQYFLKLLYRKLGKGSPIFVIAEKPNGAQLITETNLHLRTISC